MTIFFSFVLELKCSILSDIVAVVNFKLQTFLFEGESSEFGLAALCSTQLIKTCKIMYNFAKLSINIFIGLLVSGPPRKATVHWIGFKILLMSSNKVKNFIAPSGNRSRP